MKGKIGIIAVGIIMLFISQAFYPATAIEEQNDKSRTISVDISYTLKYGTWFDDTIELTEEEFNEMKDELSTLFENINTGSEFEKITEKITDIQLFNRRPLLRRFITYLLNNLERDRRPFAMSYGSCYSMSPIDKNNMKLRNMIYLWRYDGITGMEPKTYIIQSNTDEFDVYEGRQMGLMTRFIGIFMSMIDCDTNTCRVFFLGSPRNIRGMVY